MADGGERIAQLNPSALESTPEAKPLSGDTYHTSSRGVKPVRVYILGDKENTLLTNPNQWNGAYFMPGVFEGAYLLMSRNIFTYPHAKHTIDDLIT